MQKKTVGIIIRIILGVILIPILLASIIIMVKSCVYPDKIPDILGYKPMIVLTSSMEDTIYAGDLIFVKIVDTSTLEENNIIAFRNEENTVTTHRIVKINEDGTLTTKGDNNDSEDAELVSLDKIEGIYVYRIAKLGSFLMLLKRPSTLISILLGILVIGLIWIHLIDKKENKEYKEYLNKIEKLKNDNSK